jgi:energy-coupling factor transport system permease protein
MNLVPETVYGQYLPGTSTVHRIDPRAKLIACLMAMAATFAPGRPWGVVCAWPLLVLGTGAARLPPARFLRCLRSFGWLFAFLVVLHGLTGRGAEPRPNWMPPLGLSADGLVVGVRVASQMATAIAFSSLLTLTTSPAELVWAVERLASPLVRLRVPVRGFCFTLLVALRLLPKLFEEAERLGTVPGPEAKGVRALVRRHSSRMAALFRRALERAEAEAALAEDLEPERFGGSVKKGWLGLSEGFAVGVAMLTAVASAVWGG